MSSLSPRAESMIRDATRYQVPTDRAEVATILAARGIPPCEVFLAFQERWGGLSLDQRGSQLPWQLGILWEHDGEWQVGPWQEDGEWRMSCGGTTIPVELVLSSGGVLYLETTPVASSPEQWLESLSLARRNAGMAGWDDCWLGHVHQDDCAFEAGIGLPVVAEASDEYTRWWANEALRFRRAPFSLDDKRIDSLWASYEVREGRRHLAGLTALLEGPEGPHLIAWQSAHFAGLAPARRTSP